ncbi:GTP-binding protein HSR1 [Crassaminicella thermophila]|uniref:GTP-binding protein HSR1 n=1 Tax=Crassaminicella thermophila TaxID=2599308 RepID=A0A5C0SDY3_CRATE|nr:GTPase [Crassaminicella thermophila]QEK12172.1 GTP-binding protein HSR1 [Crassaminicella thermophila]
MRNCLVIGKPNAGKTLFILNFAEYLGFKNIEIKSIKNDEKVEVKKYSTEEAKRILSSSVPYKTTCLQSIEIEIPILKGRKIIKIIDSSGLIDGIHKDVKIRRAMGQTLGALRESDIILHIIDISKLNYNNVIESIGEVDYQLIKYGAIKEGYAILGNKIDLLERKTPIIQLQKEFSDHYIIPISALLKRGFGEVKSYVSRRL